MRSPRPVARRDGLVNLTLRLLLIEDLALVADLLYCADSIGVGLADAMRREEGGVHARRNCLHLGGADVLVRVRALL